MYLQDDTYISKINVSNPKVNPKTNSFNCGSKTYNLNNMEEVDERRRKAGSWVVFMGNNQGSR